MVSLLERAQAKTLCSIIIESHVDFVAELPIRLKTVTNLNILNRPCPSIKNQFNRIFNNQK